MSEVKYGYEVVRKGDHHVTTVVFFDGQEPSSGTITGDQPNYQEVVTAITSDEPVELVRDLFNAALALQRKLHSLTDRVTIRDQTLYFDGDELHGALAEQIVRHFREGVEFGPLVNFLERLASNPGKDNTPEARQFVVNQSYRFIQAARLDITPEGFFVGFKGARESEPNQFESTWSGHAFVQNGDEIEEIINDRVPSTIGTVVTMPRGEVAFNPQVSCSTGLHVGTRSYASGFGNATLRVIVDPRDIVSVPENENEKMRVCRYVVDGKEDRGADRPSFDGPIYTSPYASDLYTPESADETPDESLGEVPDEGSEFTQGDGPNRKKAESIAAKHGYRVVDYDNVVSGETVLGQNCYGETLDIPPFTVRDENSGGFVAPRYIVVGADSEDRPTLPEDVFSTPQGSEDTPVDPNQTAFDLGVKNERFAGFTAGLPADSDGRVIIEDEDEDSEDDIEPEYCEYCGEADCYEGCVSCTQCGDEGCIDCEPDEVDDDEEDSGCGDPSCSICN